MLTPRTDALIAEGIQLDRHYTYAYCSPSRSSLMSGRLPFHVNQINLPGYYAGSGVARNMTMIPKKLKQVGYSTHMMCVSMLLLLLRLLLRIRLLLLLLLWLRLASH